MKKEYAVVDVESAILEKLINQEQDAFTDLFETYWPVLLSITENYVEDLDTCKEIVQELFIALYKKKSSLRIRYSLSSYLFASLRNRIRNYSRNELVYKKHVQIAGKLRSTFTGGLNNVEQFIGLMELERQIHKCLDAMPPKYKEVYMLRWEEHQTVKNISFILNRPVDTIEKQLRKATVLLRSHLTNYNLAQ